LGALAGPQVFAACASTRRRDHRNFALAKSPGGLHAYGDLFEQRRALKRYLAVVRGTPTEAEWSCREPLGPHPKIFGRVAVDLRNGKEAVTHFRLLQRGADEQGRPCALVEARPLTGRTHQIRVHCQRMGHPVLGDPLYGDSVVNAMPEQFPLALRPSN